MEILQESKATGIKLVRSPAGKLFVRNDTQILVDTKVLSHAEIAFEEAVAERRTSPTHR